MPKRDPFAVRLSKTVQDDLIEEIRFEIDSEVDARSRIIAPNGDLDYYLHLYEGGDRKITKDFPWPGAANLTSYLGMESVDAFRARIVQTIFSDPICIAEGWGEAAERAPFVEEFHQWKAEEERLQTYMSKAVHNGLLEGTGILEVFERPLKRRIQTKRKVAVQVDPLSGGAIVDDRNQMVPARDEFGGYIDATTDATPSTSILANDFTVLRRGPQYRILSLRDFLFLPGTASDKADIWGNAKRVWKRVGDLQSDVLDGRYDKQAVIDIGEEDERETYAYENRRGVQRAVKRPGRFAEKELWEVSLLHDLDNDGYEEWYCVTIHVRKGKILRVQRDDLNLSRFVPFTPFPRPDSVYGYTLIEKLLTIIEEHTSIRNSTADRSTLVNAAPMMRVLGSPWNPYLVPWGPLAVMDVRDTNEIKQLSIGDVPGSMIERERNVIVAKERVMGLSDSSLGVHPQVDRTLGEVQLVNLQSQVRTDEIIKNVQESIEDLFQLRHEIWVRTLREQPEGEPIPESVLSGVEERGISIPGGRVTDQMIAGQFRFKPRGSTDTADLVRMRGDFNGFLEAMAKLSTATPMIGQVLSIPEVIRMILNQAMRVYRWQDRHTLNTAIAKVNRAIAASAGQPQLPPGVMEGEVVNPQIPAAAPAAPAPAGPRPQF